MKRCSLVVLMILAATLLPASASAQTYDYLYQWGTQGSGDGEFLSPTGVTIDASGNVYVVDGGWARIQKFTNAGAYLTQWGTHGTGSGQFDLPTGVAVDGSGNVYVADKYNHRIQKFTSDGIFISAWGDSGAGNGQFDHPEDVVVDGSGNVYVVDCYNHRIQKFTSSGGYLTQWGTPGIGNGQFYYPLGVAVDNSGNVYVANLNRIQKFTSAGTFILKWGAVDDYGLPTPGSGDGQFNVPTGIALDASGNVYVADSMNDRIQKFTSDGTYLTKWGGIYGNGDGQFEFPGDVAVAASGNVYVADVDNNRIQVFGLMSNDVPTAPLLAFTLDPVRPNPSRGGALTVHFSLPTDAPARLDLLDVAGRRIASHEVGVGQHTLDLGVGQHLSPGLYLVRLTQGANTRTRRVAVIR